MQMDGAYTQDFKAYCEEIKAGNASANFSSFAQTYRMTEQTILKAVKFRTIYPISSDFLHVFCKMTMEMHPDCAQIRAHAEAIVELCLTEYRMIQYKPSVISVAALLCTFELRGLSNIRSRWLDLLYREFDACFIVSI